MRLGKKDKINNYITITHDLNQSIMSSFTGITRETVSREIQKLKKELYDIIAHHSGKTYEQVWEDSDRDYWMTAEEAKKYGMIDEVLTRS